MTAVYRFYNERGDLIYVGITDRLGVRLAQHSRKPWFREVADIKIRYSGSRELAAREEADAIDACRPKYNVGKKIGLTAGVSCSVEDCERPRRARGLCGGHYMRARDRGELPKTWERG